MTAARRRAAASALALALSCAVGATLIWCVAPRLLARGQPRSPTSEQQLVADLDILFEDSLAIWGVSIRSLDRNETLYARNAQTLLEPASTTKLLTLATAAEQLGWNFRFETRLLATTLPQGGALGGDLIIHGTGDPTINGPNSDTDLFSVWAQELRAAGIQRVDGRLVGDDRAFRDDVWTGWGPGWGWDDLGFGFAARAGPLQHRENVAILTIRPGQAPGDPAQVQLEPPGALDLWSDVGTGRADENMTLTLRRLPGPSDLVLRGNVPAGSSLLTRRVSVNNPTEFFVKALHRTLVQQGLVVTGDAVDIDHVPTESQPALDELTIEIAVHHSSPLAEFGVTMMKDSHNLYAESLLRAIGLGSSAQSSARGAETIARTLSAWGIDNDRVGIVDGSGLSPLNLVAADALVALLDHMARSPVHHDRFMRTLPIAGRDGTLATRMRGTAAAGNARAKTGTRSGVRALAGYVDTADDERVAFAIIANNFAGPSRQIVRTIDAAVNRLASHRRD